MERLRLVQDAATPLATNSSSNRRSRVSGRRRSATHASTSKTNNTQSSAFASSFTRTPTRRLHKSRTSRSSNHGRNPSRTEIDWYKSLPEKIQRRHFTREERLCLAGRSDTVILDAADEAFYRRGHQANRSESTLHSQSEQTRSASPPANLQDTALDPPADTEVLPDSAIDMDGDNFGGNFRWLEDEEDIDLRLDDYHSHIARAANIHGEPGYMRRKPSFRRAFSFNNMPLGRHSLSFGSPKPPSRSQSAAATHILPSKVSHSRASSRPTSQMGMIDKNTHGRSASIATIDPSAQYYQDPEARLKLRVYLASPQKFDEAVEFGFPSLFNKENEPEHQHQRTGSTTRSKNVPESNRTFFQDDAASTHGDQITQATGAPFGIWSGTTETQCYTTRQDSTTSKPRTRRHTANTRSKSDSNVLRPRTVPSNVQPYVKSSAHNREMTLKMTLTRPDLRAADCGPPSPAFSPVGPFEQPFPTSGQSRRASLLPTLRPSEDDPLRLEALPTLGSYGNIWDTVPEEKGVMKKMWRKIRMK